jgi:hypothetical protein
MNKFLLVAMLCLSGCTYSINQVHTEGAADDIIDTTATPSTVLTPIP